VQADLAKLVLRATEAGSIVETSQKVGATVVAKLPVLKWRGRSLHGDFTMDQEDFLKASKLEFCRVEVSGLGTPGTTPGAQTPGAAPPPAPAAGAAPTASADGGAAGELRYVDCMLPPPAPPPVNGVPSLLRKFIVTLPTDAGLVTGQQLHLARKRYDGVFPLPLSAVETVSQTDGKIWVAAPNGTAEQRNISIAEQRDEVLVAAGINVGDEIIVEPRPGRTPGPLGGPHQIEGTLRSRSAAAPAAACPRACRSTGPRCSRGTNPRRPPDRPASAARGSGDRRARRCA